MWRVNKRALHLRWMSGSGSFGGLVDRSDDPVPVPGVHPSA
jgi:hypothetical protein